jgi:hypothetical protein
MAVGVGAGCRREVGGLGSLWRRAGVDAAEVAADAPGLAGHRNCRRPTLAARAAHPEAGAPAGQP